MKLAPFIFPLVALSFVARAADPVVPTNSAPEKTIQFAPDGQVILPEAAYLLGRMPGVEYAKEPSQPIISKEEDFSDTRKLLKSIPATWQGIPSVAVAPNGRLWVACWTGGDQEHDRHTKNQMVLYTAASLDAPLEGPVVMPKSDHGYYVFNPVLWMDPTGRLWFAYVELGVGEEGLSVVAMVTGNPTGSHPAWEKPRIITPGHMANKPTVLKNGDWIWPAEDFTNPKERKNRLFVSKDQGKTFSFYSSLRVEGSDFPELMTVEKNDGSLWMLTRTTKGIGEATSSDGGKTWKDVQTLPGIQTTAVRFHVTRLKSGRLLLVYNDNPKFRGNMTAALSEDDGRTWKAKLLLDDYGHVTYPDAQQLADGSIVIVYDKNRYKIKPAAENPLPLTQTGEIKLAHITEEDILAGKLVSPGSFTHRVIQKLEWPRQVAGETHQQSLLRFEFDGSLDGWKTNPECEVDPNGDPGALTLTYSGPDPWISSPLLNVGTAGEPLFVTLRLKVSSPGNITLYYEGTDDRGFSSEHKISKPVPPEAIDQWTDISFELPINAVRSLRLDPSGTSGSICIDWLEVRGR